MEVRRRSVPSRDIAKVNGMSAKETPATRGLWLAVRGWLRTLPTDLLGLVFSILSGLTLVSMTTAAAIGAISWQVWLPVVLAALLVPTVVAGIRHHWPRVYFGAPAANATGSTGAYEVLLPVTNEGPTRTFRACVSGGAVQGLAIRYPDDTLFLAWTETGEEVQIQRGGTRSVEVLHWNRQSGGNADCVQFTRPGHGARKHAKQDVAANSVTVPIEVCATADGESKSIEIVLEVDDGGALAARINDAKP